MTVRIIEGDARDAHGIAAASVHLVVTSPPYPMIPQWDALFGRLGAPNYAAMHELLGAVWARCWEYLVPGGILAINVGDALRSTASGFQLFPNHVDVTDRCRSLGFVPLPYLLWKKPTNRPNAFLGSGFLPPNAYVTLDCEFILLFRKGSLRRLPPKDPARARSAFTKAERDRWFSQVWSDIRGTRQGADGQRTGAFPPEVPERLIRMFSCSGETVLDPFAGTGTTLWAAARWGRDAIGIEVDPTAARALRQRAAALSGPAASRPPTVDAAAPRRRRSGGSATPSR